MFARCCWLYRIIPCQQDKRVPEDASDRGFSGCDGAVLCWPGPRWGCHCVMVPEGSSRGLVTDKLELLIVTTIVKLLRTKGRCRCLFPA